MSFSIYVKKSMLNSLKELDKSRKEQVIQLINILKREPIPARHYEVKKLSGYDNKYRLRSSGLKVVYEVCWNRKLIIIHFIGT